MSTNPYYRYMLAASGAKEKEPFFQRTWGKVNLLSRDMQRKTYKEYRASNPELQVSHYKAVLSTFNNKSIQHEAANQIQSLADEAMMFLEEEKSAAKRRQREGEIKGNAIHAYIGKIVEALSPYAGIVNMTVGHTEMHTVLTGPEIVSEEIKLPGAHDSFEYRRDYQARFSTRTWSLLFRGTDGRIDIFLMPVDKVMRLTKVETFYRPVAKLYADLRDTRIHWILDGQELDAEQRSAFFLSLFHQLLDRTKNQMIKDRGGNASAVGDLIDMALTNSAIKEGVSVDSNYDYRQGKPDLFGPEEQGAVYPLRGYSEAEKDCQTSETIDVFSDSAAEKRAAEARAGRNISEFLLTENDFKDSPAQRSAENHLSTNGSTSASAPRLGSPNANAPKVANKPAKRKKSKQRNKKMR